MLHNDLKEKLDILYDNISWSDIIPVSKESGTIQCPFCGKNGKGYLYPNYFKCFSSKCGVQGQKINIYMKYKNLSFGEALRELEGNTCLDYQSQKDEFDKRNEVMSSVLDAYEHELYNNPKAIEWLINRGFDESFIKQCRIGYAPHSSVLRGYDLNTNTLKRHKLLTKKGEFFRERIVFPIYNTAGYLVHMTGRSFPTESEDFKYLDTSRVPIVGSSKDYLLFEEWISFYKNRDDKTLFLVEGVPDSYTLNQCGASVVGLLGLQKLLKQATKFKGFDTVIAIFDNDRYELNHPNYPGELKSWRVVINQLINLQLLLGSNVQVKTCMIPESFTTKDKVVKDVNDLYLYTNKNKEETIGILQKSSIDIVEAYIEKYKGDLSHHHEALKLIAATGRGRSFLEKYIPKDQNILDYALNVLTN